MLFMYNITKLGDNKDCKAISGTDVGSVQANLHLHNTSGSETETKKPSFIPRIQRIRLPYCQRFEP